jgi:hypothetical protein
MWAERLGVVGEIKVCSLLNVNAKIVRMLDYLSCCHMIIVKILHTSNQ